MKILTTGEMREADRLTTERFGVPSLTLMENAGVSVAEFIAAHFAPVRDSHPVILCGKGNNGGDGFVVARKLQELGAQPHVLFFGDPAQLREYAAANFDRLKSRCDSLKVVGSFAQWDAEKAILAKTRLIVDALLGTGLRGRVDGLIAQVIQDVNRRNQSCAVVAVDIPSGLSGDTGEITGPAIVADFSVTFTAPMLGMLLAPASSCTGRLIVADIGTPRELIEEIATSNLRWLEPWEFRGLPFRRAASANKGDYGHAVIVAGSLGKAGAAALAAQAALRVGAGLVTVATPEPVLSTVAGFAPEIMTEPLHATAAGTIAPEVFDSGGFGKIVQGKNVVAMGPGLSTNQETQKFIRAVIASKLRVPVILDADGLNAFAGRGKELKGVGQFVALTPHPGEMSRLLGCAVSDIQAHRLETARKAAADWQASVILKGYETVLAAPDGSTWINSTGNPGMATGGTGDVLTGMLAGLTAQFGDQNWPLTLALGVYLHGLAGDLAAEELGEAPLLATDVIRCIPRALKKLSEAVQAF